MNKNVLANVAGIIS